MRDITDHIVPGDSANSQLKITVADEPGPGGACHEYVIAHLQPSGEERVLCRLSFQNGPIKSAGVNGITQEVLLAVVIDRLKGFQSGQYACSDNSDAATLTITALHALQRRTRDRIRRQVEGTHYK